MENHVPVVQKNVTILSPKLVLAYAEDILEDSRLKNHAECNAEWSKSVSVERFEIWVKNDFLGKKRALSLYYRECGIGFCCLGLICTPWFETLNEIMQLLSIM